MTTDFHSPALSWQEPRRTAPSGGLFSFLNPFWAWYDCQCARQQLETLDDRMLTDIGLSREDLSTYSDRLHRPV